MRMNISIAGAFICLLYVQIISAQDIHLSQYHFDRLQVNPALTGIFNGDKQVSLIHKQQYFSVPVDYLTFSGSFDMKFRSEQSPKGFFSAGALFNYDQAGDGDLAWMNLNIMGSYTRALTKSFFVGLGAYVGGGQRSFDEVGLKWEDQWDGGAYNPTLPSGEHFTETSFFWLDLGAGANVRLQGRDRTKIDLGVGAFHLNKPGFSFYDADNIKLPYRLTFSAMGVLKLGSRLDIFGNGLIQQQGPYEETVVGGGLIIHISNKKAREVELHLGLATRLEDALIPMVALGYDGWKAGFSYDVNTSGFKAATDKKGGPEFFVNYTFKKLWPLEQTRVCSIF
ncbi:MAG TPA: PorP/SprF family type IX secretion system membrane protein [Saprospiraceae bacterium]|nr:PorP/SprF family type IX secretion system membrane protein [Saprospiraceae bacterium]